MCLFQKVQQIASFFLPDTMTSTHLMKGHGSQMLLLVSWTELQLFTIHGLQLAAFQDHQERITSLCVVSVAPPRLNRGAPPGGGSPHLM